MDNKRYDEMTDEELIRLLRAGENEISDYMCNKYKNLVRKNAASMYILGAEPEDIIQEGMIGLFKAVRDYDPQKDASFYTFAELCISRQIYTAIQAAGRKKHMPLNTYVSLYGDSEENGDKSGSLEEYTGSDVCNPEQVLIDRENVEDIERAIDENLSAFERQVLDLHLTGLKYVQIARILGRDEKSTDNALQRIRSKIKKILD